MSLPADPIPVVEPLTPTEPTWVVCLCADWCGVCRDYRSVFEQVAAQHPQLRFAWLDVEDQASLVGDLDIETFPTLLVASVHGARFMGTLTPHLHTLSRLLEALGDSADERKVVSAPLDIAALLQTLQAGPEFWVGN
ncbi:MAG: thioredoxin family protein [Polaromonas sp.]